MYMNKQVNYNDAYNAKKFSNGVYIMNFVAVYMKLLVLKI